MEPLYTPNNNEHNPAPSIEEEFETGRALTREEILKLSPEEVTVSLWHDAAIDSKKCRMALLSAMNSMIFNLGVKSGFLVKAKDGLKTMGSKLGKLMSIRAFSSPITWITEHAREFWGEVGRTTMTKVVDAMESIGLFRRSTAFDPATKKNTPSLFMDFSLEKLLKVYNQLEQLFVQAYGWDALPRHKGASVMVIFNAVIKKGLGFGRKGQISPDVVVRDDASDDDWMALRQEWNQQIDTTRRRRLAAIEEILGSPQAMVMPESVVDKLYEEREYLRHRIGVPAPGV